DYLVNDFEAKWRKREGKSSGFPIMIRPHTHTYYSWLKWHYYMGELTGKSAYTKEAQRMEGELWKDIKSVSTTNGTAYVWTRSVTSEGGSADYLHPTTYARYVYSDLIEFYLQGIGRWATDENMKRFARTVATWVIDVGGAERSKDWFASDIGGGTSRAGIRSDPDWARMDVYKYEVSAYALIMYWDPTNKIDNITSKVMASLGGADRARTIYLP